MYSSPTPASGSLASAALRKAGLMDGDATMRDVSGSKRPGLTHGKKHIKTGHRSRASEAITGTSSLKTSRPAASSTLTIRGADRRTATDRDRRRKTLAATSGSTSLSIAKSKVIAIKGHVVDQWKEFVEHRYDRVNQFLNLSNMIEDEIVKKYHLTPPGHGGNSREAAVIYKLAKQLSPPVAKLDLSNNHLGSEHLSLLSHYLPDIDALSLMNNDIRHLKDLDIIAGRAGKERFTRLHELMLAGNPLHVQEYQYGRQDSFKADVVKRFPTITMLDHEPLAVIMFDAPGKGPCVKPSATTFPLEMRSSNITGADGALVTSFLARFFDLFDKNRMALIDVYHETCTYSFSANTTIPERARLQGWQVKLPNQKSLDWKVWLDNSAGGSRNLTRLKAWVDKHDSRLKMGNEETVRTLAALPATDHELTADGSADKFCIDSMLIPHGAEPALLVIIHGQFKEVPSQGIRSFDRSFILAPAAPGSRAQVAGWPVVILSDHWTIRNYSAHGAWKPGPMLVQAEKRAPAPKLKAIEAISAAATTIAPTVALPEPQYTIPTQYQAIFLQVPEPQQAILIQFCRTTNLQPVYGQDCLSRNDYNFQAALSNFEAARSSGQLGAEAYMQQS